MVLEIIYQKWHVSGHPKSYIETQCCALVPLLAPPRYWHELIKMSQWHIRKKQWRGGSGAKKMALFSAIFKQNIAKKNTVKLKYQSLDTLYKFGHCCIFY